MEKNCVINRKTQYCEDDNSFQIHNLNEMSIKSPEICSVAIDKLVLKLTQREKT